MKPDYLAYTRTYYMSGCDGTLISIWRTGGTRMCGLIQLDVGGATGKSSTRYQN